MCFDLLIHLYLFIQNYNELNKTKNIKYVLDFCCVTKSIKMTAEKHTYDKKKTLTTHTKHDKMNVKIGICMFINRQ